MVILGFAVPVQRAINCRSGHRLEPMSRCMMKGFTVVEPSSHRLWIWSLSTHPFSTYATNQSINQSANQPINLSLLCCVVCCCSTASVAASAAGMQVIHRTAGPAPQVTCRISIKLPVNRVRYAPTRHLPLCLSGRCSAQLLTAHCSLLTAH